MSSRRNEKSSSKSTGTKSSGSGSKSSKSSSKSAETEKEAPKRSNEEMLPSVLPSEILAAIAKDLKANPKGHGDGVFRIDLKRIKKHMNKQKQETRYIPFEVNIGGNWVPVAIKFQNAKTEGGVKPPDKRKYGPSLTFKKSSTFTRTDKSGKEFIERYGDAVFACNEAFVRIATKLVKDKELKNGKNQDILEFVQKQRLSDPQNKDSDLVDMDDPIFRPKLAVDDEGKFRINQGIRDLRKKVPKDKRAKGQLPYELATDDDGVALNPDNVHNFIKMATPCFGVHDLSQACCSQKGISVPSSIVLLMAKKPQGRKPTFDKHFDETEMEGWGDVDAFEQEGEAETDADEAPEAAETAEAGEYGELMDAVDEAASDADDIENPASEEKEEKEDEEEDE